MCGRDCWRHGCYLYGTWSFVRIVSGVCVPRLTSVWRSSFPSLPQQTLLHLRHLLLSVEVAISKSALFPGAHPGKIESPDSSPAPLFCQSEQVDVGVRWHSSASCHSELYSLSERDEIGRLGWVEDGLIVHGGCESRRRSGRCLSRSIPARDSCLHCWKRLFVQRFLLLQSA